MLRMNNSWGLIIPSVTLGTRQSTTFGTAVTPNQNDIANATYAELIDGALVTADCQDIEIVVAQVSVSAAARDCLVTIGMDPSAGTTYTDTISNLVCGPASRGGGGDGQGAVFFRFPLRVAAGTSIAAKASVNSATLAAIRVYCILRGKPSHPELIRTGSVVTTFGANTATSAGTAVVPGTVARGSYVQMGSATARPYFYAEFGFGVNDATMNQAQIAVDIAHGDATNKNIIIQEAGVWLQNIECVSKPAQGQYCSIATGDLIYARSQSSNSANDGESIAVYLVGD